MNLNKIKIINEHLHGLEFSEAGATPTEIALFLRMKDAMDSYGKELSIGFYRWVRTNYSENSHGLYKYDYFKVEEENEYFEIEKLFPIYLDYLETLKP